ncbi:hypothetical protein K438DRAFT_845374 [Mycena galopus ATCC 62051]|nr:hypothetical protein K438DRAFT_845374 [Mycena galopus ATCC 62051]
MARCIRSGPVLLAARARMAGGRDSDPCFCSGIRRLGRGVCIRIRKSSRRPAGWIVPARLCSWPKRCTVWMSIPSRPPLSSTLIIPGKRMRGCPPYHIPSLAHGTRVPCPPSPACHAAQSFSPTRRGTNEKRKREHRKRRPVTASSCSCVGHQIQSCHPLNRTAPTIWVRRECTCGRPWARIVLNIRVIFSPFGVRHFWISPSGARAEPYRRGECEVGGSARGSNPANDLRTRHSDFTTRTRSDCGGASLAGTGRWALSGKYNRRAAVAQWRDYASRLPRGTQSPRRH